MIILILYDGSGKRLWFKNHTQTFKQFAQFTNGLTLFRKAIATSSAICESQFTVSNAD